jgi:hypothetical protein
MLRGLRQQVAALDGIGSQLQSFGRGHPNGMTNRG